LEQRYSGLKRGLEPRSWQGVPDTTLCEKVCQLFATSRWFSLGTPVSSTNKTDHHDITEILLWRLSKLYQPSVINTVSYMYISIEQ
jgi:hypothetical protein